MHMSLLKMHERQTNSIPIDQAPVQQQLFSCSVLDPKPLVFNKSQTKIYIEMSDKLKENNKVS